MNDLYKGLIVWHYIGSLETNGLINFTDDMDYDGGLNEK